MYVKEKGKKKKKEEESRYALYIVKPNGVGKHVQVIQ